MVVVAQRVVDGIGVVLDGAKLDGFNGLKHIHAAKAVGVALAHGQRHSRFLKDTTNLFRCQVDVFAQHERHAARHARRRHRSATHQRVARIALVVNRLNVNTRGAHIGTNEADARVVGIVSELSVGPSDRAL